jgi:UDP-N-acetylmuramoyl-tripeptide--D-alanyl-D-alanine ligase
MELTTSEIARAVQGHLHGDPGAVDGASIDSRKIVEDQLFVPIVAERDGHDYIGAAIESGAAAYLTSRGSNPEIRAPAIEVDDTMSALTRLGSYVRSTRLGPPVVGVTGSVGKTTVKDMIAAIVSTERNVAASVGSFNNELGVPLTLLNAPEGSDACIIEMGARGRGHVRDLCEIARPTIGVVTTVAMAHTELFGDLDGVARAKRELIEALPPTGVAVLNADDRRVAGMAGHTDARIVTFGDAGEVRAEGLELDSELRATFRMVFGDESFDVVLGPRGGHQVSNALAAAAVAWTVGISTLGIAAGLAREPRSPWRMELSRTAAGLQVINDAYNANPTSMRAALDALTEIAAPRRIAVLGVMAELGPSAREAHEGVAESAKMLGIQVIAVDAPHYGPSVIHVADQDEAMGALSDLGPMTSEVAVLLKGSRVAGLERLAERLKETSA